MRNARKSILCGLMAASLAGLTGCVVDADRDHDHRDHDDHPEIHDHAPDRDHDDHDHDHSMSHQMQNNEVLAQWPAISGCRDA